MPDRQAQDRALPQSGHDDPVLLNATAIIAAAGAIALVAGNVIGSIVVPGHDFVADTVSDLAAGRYEIIQDVALYGFAAALFACAIGMANLHGGSRRWTAAILALALQGGIVAVIGARNEYGDGDSEGVVIHVYLVYALGALFTLIFFAAARGLGRAADGYRRFSIGCGVAWTLAAPVFFFLPTGIDGLYERGLGLIAVVWVLMLALFLRRSARRTAST